MIKKKSVSKENDCENVKQYSCFGEQSRDFLKDEIQLPYDPGIPHLRIHSKGLKTGIQTKSRT